MNELQLSREYFPILKEAAMALVYEAKKIANNVSNYTVDLTSPSFNLEKIYAKEIPASGVFAIPREKDTLDADVDEIPTEEVPSPVATPSGRVGGTVPLGGSSTDQPLAMASDDPQTLLTTNAVVPSRGRAVMKSFELRLESYA